MSAAERLSLKFLRLEGGVFGNDNFENLTLVVDGPPKAVSVAIGALAIKDFIVFVLNGLGFSFGQLIELFLTRTL